MLAQDIEWTPELIADALDGNRRALGAIARLLLPHIHAEVGRRLARIAHKLGDVSEEARDQTQNVFVHLLRRNGQALRRWNPERGRSLVCFVRLIARRQTSNAYRRRRLTAEVSLPSGRIEQIEQDPVLERHTASAQRLAALLDFIHENYSAQGVERFYMIYVLELTREEICRRTRASPSAINNWCFRLRRRLREYTPEDNR